MRKFTLMALLGVFLAVLCTPVFMAETEAPPNQPQKINLTFDNPIQGIQLSMSQNLKSNKVVRMRVLKKDAIETYFINPRKKLPKTIKYSALKPDNKYGIRIESIMIRGPGDFGHLAYMDYKLPAKVNLKKVAMRQLE